MATNVQQPLCRYCGKKIAKRTRTVIFGQTRYRPDDDHTIFREEKPASKAEAQRVLNQEVVSVRWYRTVPLRDDWSRDPRDPGHDFIEQATTWDGESYADSFFCNGEHAKRFAYVMAKAGHATQAYQEAVEAAMARDNP